MSWVTVHIAVGSEPAVQNCGSKLFQTYSTSGRALDVTFVSGRRYRYVDVPEEVAEAFREAFSKGRFFNARIRDVYRYIELGEEAVADEELWAL